MSLHNRDLELTHFNSNECYIINYLDENAKENVLRVKAEKVKVVDTTGAGDAFDAAFCYKYLKCGDAKKSAEFANLFALLVVKEYEARPKIEIKY